jgi:hypothetical protein
MSGTIVSLFEKLMPFIEKNHIKAHEKKSKYEIISNPEEKRHSIHCYMPEGFYLKIKQLHHDLNYFSMAQLLRKMIDYFIAGCLKYGIKKFLEKLNKIINIWKIKKDGYKKEKMLFMQQLFTKNPNLPNILIYYDHNSRPYTMQFI